MPKTLCIWSWVFFNPHVRTFFHWFLGREEGRETLMWERSIKWLSLVCTWSGTKPSTYVCAPTGNHTHDLSITGGCSNELSHMARATCMWSFWNSSSEKALNIAETSNVYLSSWHIRGVPSPQESHSSSLRILFSYSRPLNKGPVWAEVNWVSRIDSPVWLLCLRKSHTKNSLLPA